MSSIFGTDGIRGRFAKEITYSLAYKVGYAMGVITEKNNVENTQEVQKENQPETITSYDCYLKICQCWKFIFIHIYGLNWDLVSYFC